MDSKTDNVLPRGRWAFDAEVTDCFEDMLWRSIPQYEIMRELVTFFAIKNAKRNTHIIDIGCSKGAQIAHIRKFTKPGDIKFIGLEISKPMLEASQERFKDDPDVEIREHDLRRDPYPEVASSVALSVLTLQFVPVNYRQRIMTDVYESLCKGGALVMVEKVIGASATIDCDMLGGYFSMKALNGYTKEQIDRKNMALEGVLVPLTERSNIELIKQAGFKEIDCFWRWLNFAGWIAIK